MFMTPQDCTTIVRNASVFLLVDLDYHLPVSHMSWSIKSGTLPTTPNHVLPCIQYHDSVVQSSGMLLYFICSDRPMWSLPSQPSSWSIKLGVYTTTPNSIYPMYTAFWECATIIRNASIFCSVDLWHSLSMILISFIVSYSDHHCLQRLNWNIPMGQSTCHNFLFGSEHQGCTPPLQMVCFQYKQCL